MTGASKFGGGGFAETVLLFLQLLLLQVENSSPEVLFALFSYTIR